MNKKSNVKVMSNLKHVETTRTKKKKKNKKLKKKAAAISAIMQH